MDGTGAPGRGADVAITGGRISDIGTRLQGDRVLDASGQVVAPGFVDIHTHYDAQVFWDPLLTPSSFHGVTSVIAGNCGFSIAPIRAEGVPLLARTLQHVEDMSFDTLAVGVPWDEFETFPQYLDAVEGRDGAQLRVLRRPHRGAALRHGRGRLRAPGHRRRDRAHAGRRGRRHGGRGRRVRLQRATDPQRRQRRPVPSRVADLDDSCPPRAGQAVRAGVVALLPGGVFPNTRSSDSSARWAGPSPGRRC